LQAPRDVHNVNDHMLRDFFDPGTPKHKVDYSGGNHGNMYKVKGRNNAANGVDGSCTQILVCPPLITIKGDVL
jgi:hypothetical protein